MARNKSNLQFEGQLGGVNGYLPKNRDLKDGSIIRTNGGPSAKQINSLDSCKIVRLNIDDFATCSSAGKSVRLAMHPVTHLADINIAPKLLSLCKHIQKEDKDHQLGERRVLFSQYGYYLSGFNLNRRYSFDSVVRHPLMATLDRGQGMADIQVPELLQDINLTFPWKQPLYRLILTMGVVNDRWTISRGQHHGGVVSHITPWTITGQVMPAQKVVLQLQAPVYEKECMIVAVGIEMGMMLSDAVIQPVKNTGCAKVLIAG